MDTLGGGQSAALPRLLTSLLTSIHNKRIYTAFLFTEKKQMCERDRAPPGTEASWKRDVKDHEETLIFKAERTQKSRKLLAAW